MDDNAKQAINNEPPTWGCCKLGLTLEQSATNRSAAVLLDERSRAKVHILNFLNKTAAAPHRIL